MLVELLQARLIYFPSSEYHSTPRDVGLSYERVDLKSTDGELIAAWYVPKPGAKGSVLFCHGNAGNIADRLATIQAMHQLGYNILVFDYRGYGESTGRPTEAGTYLDAEAAWTHLVNDRHEKPARIAVFGESLGGAVAIELALRHPPGAVVVQATFTSLIDIGRLHYPLLPVGWILRYRYESINKIGQVAAPKLFIHATATGSACSTRHPNPNNSSKPLAVTTPVGLITHTKPRSAWVDSSMKRSAVERRPCSTLNDPNN